MDILEQLRIRCTDQNELQTTDLLGGVYTYTFKWNEPISSKYLESIKRQYQLVLPSEYEKFLLKSNGAILYNDDEGAGYKLLALEDAISFTNEVRERGYDIDEHWLIFMSTLFGEDILLFDLSAKSPNKCIIDGDFGYPIRQWSYLNGGFQALMTRLFQTNGAMFWRW